MRRGVSPMGCRISHHAKGQACLRWMLPDEEHALQAIRDVLRHGVMSEQADGLAVYRWGSRIVRVVENTAVTVLVYRQKQTARAQHKARRDMKSRRRRCSP